MQPNDPTIPDDQYRRPAAPAYPRDASQPTDTNEPAPQQMYYTRPLEPRKPVISEEIRRKHEASKQKYPQLNLSDGEYILSDVKRHPIGLIQIWGFVVIVVAVAFGGVLAVLTSIADKDMAASLSLPLLIGAGLLSCLALVGGYVGNFVYRSNRFYLTNESVIQNIQTSLFSNREQTVSLGNIEDASYARHGIVQHMFDYGSLRLSTEGDETTYRFSFAAQPAKQIAILNNAVEAFKNGRPISEA